MPLPYKQNQKQNLIFTDWLVGIRASFYIAKCITHGYNKYDFLNKIDYKNQVYISRASMSKTTAVNPNTAKQVDIF